MTSNRKRKEYLKKQLATQQSQIATRYVSPNVAVIETITFAFNNLNLKRGRFVCNPGDGEKLIWILNELKKHSGYTKETIGSRKNCHYVPEDQIRSHALQDIIDANGGKKLFQLGSKDRPERIVGYFEIRANVFAVCYIDLQHNLSGKRR